MVNNILLLPLNPFASGCNMEHLAGHLKDYSMTMDGAVRDASQDIDEGLIEIF